MVYSQRENFDQNCIRNFIRIVCIKRKIGSYLYIYMKTDTHTHTFSVLLVSFYSPFFFFFVPSFPFSHLHVIFVNSLNKNYLKKERSRPFLNSIFFYQLLSWKPPCLVPFMSSFDTVNGLLMLLMDKQTKIQDHLYNCFPTHCLVGKKNKNGGGC